LDLWSADRVESFLASRYPITLQKWFPLIQSCRAKDRTRLNVGMTGLRVDRSTFLFHVVLACELAKRYDCPMESPYEIQANVVEILSRRITPSKVTVADGLIASIEPTGKALHETYLLPGFVDSHVHIESSMLVPSEFARAAVCHGTVATVSDPHEIGNVLGVEGVEFMLRNASSVPFKFCFGAPACVPATIFETAGATIGAGDVQRLLADDRIGYLSEVMDFPAVLRRDPDIMRKLIAAKANGKLADGHAPGVRGSDAVSYFAAGISTDHECVTKDEALDKIAAGCHVSIREGSAARNFDALVTLIDEFPEQVMLCSDDKHPDELMEGHINLLVRRAIASGIDRFHVLRAACVNPVALYGLPVGQLCVGDAADFIEVEDLESFHVIRTTIDGQVVAENGKSRIVTSAPTIVNQFHAQRRRPDEFVVRAESQSMNIIQALDGQLITNRVTRQPRVVGGNVEPDVSRDILKLTVINRYEQVPPAVAFVTGFGLRAGAMASSVAHDSHNIIAVGVDDVSICQAVNLVIDNRGGLSAVDGADDTTGNVLPLPVAGLMSVDPIEAVSAVYETLDAQVKALGSPLRAPFMTLSFMALLVIPEIKLSDRGLFDGVSFEFLPLFN
jgi:adenine deaminase